MMAKFRHWSRRRWFAEDIAQAMELIEDDVPLWAVAVVFGTTAENLGHQLTKARRLGVEAFPLRSSIKVRRLLKPPRVAGQDAGRFLRTLSLRA